MIPPQLLQAAGEANALIALVVGAGCSHADPTCVPMARECAEDAYGRLLRDTILKEGDCPDPHDLSILADTVYGLCGNRQEPLIARLPLDQFRCALPNRGHMIAVALLRENVISSILCLNYDLAFDHAMALVGATEVQPLVRPEDIGQMKAHNVIYIHRNVNERDREKWIVRQASLDHEWKDGWESLLVERVLVSPVVVFVGLGSPAGVLIDTTTRIRAILTDLSVFHVDPSSAEENSFFAALGLDKSAYIESGWIEFMEALSARVCAEQLDALKNVSARFIAEECLPIDNIEGVLAELAILDIVALGELRARWLLDRSPYAPANPHVDQLMSPVLISAEAVRREVGAERVRFEKEIIDYRDAHGNVNLRIMATVGSQRSWAALEPRIRERREALNRNEIFPAGVIVSGAIGPRLESVAPPPKISFESRDVNDILSATDSFTFLDAHEVSMNPGLVGALL